MPALNADDRELLTVYVVLELAGQNDAGEDVWYFVGVTNDRDEAVSWCQNEFFAVGPAVLGELPKGAWQGLTFPRRS